jgi:hypothetical protein
VAVTERLHVLSRLAKGENPVAKPTGELLNAHERELVEQFRGMTVAEALRSQADALQVSTYDL